MPTTHSQARRARALRVTDAELGTHALAIISFLYNRVIAGAAPALRKRTGLSVTEARIVFHVGATELATANKLTKSLGLDKAAISRAINRLIGLNLMISERHPQNAASNLLRLTKVGQEHCKLITNFTFGREEHLLSVLTEQEQEQFLSSLHKILTNVESVNERVAEGHFWN